MEAATKAARYLRVINAKTKYAEHMNHLSNSIFAELTRPTNQKSMKVVKLFSEKPIQKRPEIVDYYITVNGADYLMKKLRIYGLFRDDHADFVEYNDFKRRQRGKEKWIPPPFRNNPDKKPDK